MEYSHRQPRCLLMSRDEPVLAGTGVVPRPQLQRSSKDVSPAPAEDKPCQKISSVLKKKWEVNLTVGTRCSAKQVLTYWYCHLLLCFDRCLGHESLCLSGLCFQAWVVTALLLRSCCLSCHPPCFVFCSNSSTAQHITPCSAQVIWTRGTSSLLPAPRRAEGNLQQAKLSEPRWER